MKLESVVTRTLKQGIVIVTENWNGTKILVQILVLISSCSRVLQYISLFYY